MEQRNTGSDDGVKDRRVFARPRLIAEICQNNGEKIHKTFPR